MSSRKKLQRLSSEEIRKILREEEEAKCVEEEECLVVAALENQKDEEFRLAQDDEDPETINTALSDANTTSMIDLRIPIAVQDKPQEGTSIGVAVEPQAGPSRKLLLTFEPFGLDENR